MAVNTDANSESRSMENICWFLIIMINSKDRKWNWNIRYWYTYYCHQCQDSEAHEHHEYRILIHVHPVRPSNYCSNPSADRLLTHCTPNRVANAWAPREVIYMMQYLNASDLMNLWKIAWTTVVSLCLFLYWRNCATHLNGPNALSIHVKELQITREKENQKPQNGLIIKNNRDMNARILVLTFSKNVSVADRSKYSRTFGWARKLYRFCGRKDWKFYQISFRFNFIGWPKKMWKKIFFFWFFVSRIQESLTLISSFKLFPLKSKYVSELEMLWFNVNEWAIWLTPFAVRPQCDKDSRHKPFDIFAIGPAKWTAPEMVRTQKINCLVVGRRAYTFKSMNCDKLSKLELNE